MGRMPRRLTSSQIIVLGFLGAILLGAFLLMLPISTADGKGATFADAVFTATSATCVTGLVVQDTATYWSYFGQAVILLLIQIGGMGVVTFAVAITVASGKKLGLMQRSTMQEAISAHQMGCIVQLTGFILKTSAIIEVTGAALLAPAFIKEFGVGKGIWYSFFHSISAFCNAGFDLMGVKEKFSSLTSFSDNPLVNIVIMALIIIGGIGFLVWDDIKTNKFHIRKYRMQTKIVLLTSAILILLPAVYFFLEFAGMDIKSRIFNSLFQSVTTRTAGFNTYDLTKLNSGGISIMIVLMLIGGSPGSTAGGMKTTTFAVVILTAISVFRRKEHTDFAGRSIADSVLRNAIAIVTMYLILFLTGGVVITAVEGLPMMTCMFETASAVGTVGLTLGITPNLSAVSRIILIALMYIGRVGGLTLLFSALTPGQSSMSKLPQEKLTVG
ncbi:MAG: Trk family potassium uptake protein [Clostridiales bacterium]|nr:Trk family potassium uptake protein [Clostridiales bacterium]